METGCSQIGADRELARNATGDSALADVQKMYLTWDANNLRMAWTGADWDVDGDLFIYLDTTSGGATTAYNPYASPMTINLPSELGADYLVHIEDATTARLMRWSGSAWVLERALSAPNTCSTPIAGRPRPTLPPAQLAGLARNAEAGGARERGGCAAGLGGDARQEPAQQRTRRQRRRHAVPRSHLHADCSTTSGRRSARPGSARRRASSRMPICT